MLPAGANDGRRPWTAANREKWPAPEAAPEAPAKFAIGRKVLKPIASRRQLRRNPVQRRKLIGCVSTAAASVSCIGLDVAVA